METRCSVKKKTNKGSEKSWEDFVQWLRNKIIATVKDFQHDGEWKGLINNDSELLNAKENEKGYESNSKISENNR